MKSSGALFDIITKAGGQRAVMRATGLSSPGSIPKWFIRGLPLATHAGLNKYAKIIAKLCVANGYKVTEKQVLAASLKVKRIYAKRNSD